MYKITQVEDQTKFALPLNRDTESLFYNVYLVLDANVLENPRVWQISKVNRSNSKGIAVFTCSQDLANQHTLKADYDEYGNVVAWWADWGQSNIEPKPAVVISEEEPYSEETPSDSQNPVIYSSISCTGKSQFKVGGSAKTFTVTFKDMNGDEVEQPIDGWSFYIGDDLVPEELLTLTRISETKIKVKFLGDDSYIGKILTVKCASGEVISTMDVEIIAL